MHAKRKRKYPELGAMFRQLRLNKKWSCPKLEAIAHVCHKSVVDVEFGYSLPGPKLVHRLVAALKPSREELLKLHSLYIKCVSPTSAMHNVRYNLDGSEIPIDS